MWFEELTGFRETSPQQVRNNITADGDILKSRVNGRIMTCGRLEMPSLAELRDRVQSGRNDGGRPSVRELVADVQSLHADASLAGGLFQVASQFNLLEMVSPDKTPEDGVGIYERDRTQGPACAISAGAGTIYRNYLACVNGQIGQTAENQIDCLADLGAALGNTGNRLWAMRNGYALPSLAGLEEIAGRLRKSGGAEMDELRGLLRIGIQWNTQVTLPDCNHLVSQTYCSALPIAYSQHPAHLWESFARLVLEACYEATLCAAILNSRTTANKRVFLTLVGGGAFGNPEEWIVAAIQRALDLYRSFSLEVAIVSYGHSNAAVKELTGVA
jgi:hypothetical protein